MIGLNKEPRLRFTDEERADPALEKPIRKAEKAAALCQVKTSDSLLSIFLLACFCNLLIFLAVDGFRHNHHELGKYLGLFFGVTVFILCGFEHCVANMFYFAVANWWSPHTLLYLLVMTLGNSVGGLLIPLYRLWSRRAAVV